MMRPRLTKLLSTGAVVMATLVIAGCGSDEPVEVCDEVQALEKSVATLTDVELNADTLPSVKEKLTQVRSDLDALVEAAGDEFETEIKNVKSSASVVVTSYDAAVGTPSAASVTAVAAAFQDLVTSLTSLTEAAQESC